MTCFWWSIAGFFLVAIVAYRIGMIDGKSIQRLAENPVSADALG